MIIAISDKELITSVTLKGSTYSLRRHGDNAGDSGRMLNCIDPITAQVVSSGEIIVGYCIQCGSHYARTIQQQDWWMTTPVIEILKVNADKTEVEFKTGNSIYTVRSW